MILRRDDFTPFMGVARNEPQMVHISDLDAPRLVATHAMQGPSGLAVYEGKLFICDVSTDLIIFDKSDAQALIMLDRLPELDCPDATLQGDRLGGMAKKNNGYNSIAVKRQWYLLSRIEAY